MRDTHGSLSNGCVLDAGILVKLYLPEADAMAARNLVNRLVSGPEAPAVPSLVCTECANVFWKAIRWRGFAVTDAVASIMDLLALPLRVWPSQELVRSALTVAIALEISVYDGTCLALARLLNVPLVTADAALAHAAVAAGHEVRLLSDIGAIGDNPV